MNRPARGFDTPADIREVLVPREKRIRYFLNELAGLRKRFETATAGDGRYTTTQPRFMGPFKLFRDFDSNGWNDPSALAQLNTLFLGSSPDLTKLAPRKRREAEGVLDELASLWEQLYRALSSPNDASSKVRAAVGTRVAEVLSKAPAAVEEIPVLSPEEAYTLEVFLDALSGDDRLLIRDINPLASSAESISSKELLKLIISMIKGEVDVPTSVVPVLLECMDSYSLDRPYTPKSLEYYVVLLDEVRDAVNDFESGLYS